MKLTTKNGFTIEDVVWFTDMQGHLIGLVKGKNDVDETKYYIGVGDGANEKLDMLKIAETGSRFYPELIFGWEKQSDRHEQVTNVHYALEVLEELIGAGESVPNKYAIAIPGIAIDRALAKLKEKNDGALP